MLRGFELLSRCLQLEGDYLGFHTLVTHSTRVASPNRSFGEEVARLRLAQTLVDCALESGKRYCLGLATINKAYQLKSRIIEDRTKAERDNNTIFFEPVPPESFLKPIAHDNMVTVRTVTSRPHPPTCSALPLAASPDMPGARLRPPRPGGTALLAPAAHFQGCEGERERATGGHHAGGGGFGPADAVRE
jgi:hypothetical protein